MMEKINLFTDFVTVSENEKLAVKLYPYCKQLIKKCTYDKEYENGLTTYGQNDKYLRDFKLWDPVFDELYDWILKQVEEYKQVAGFNHKHELKPSIRSLWVSEQFEMGFHEMHQHLGHKDHISGTFYIHTPVGASNLVFKRPDFDYDSWKEIPKSGKYGQYNALRYEFAPVRGHNLMWKSTTHHGTRVNKCDSRIAISYNIELLDTHEWPDAGMKDMSVNE